MKCITFLSMMGVCVLSLAQADPTPNPAVTVPPNPALVSSGSSRVPAYPTQPGAPFRPTVTSPNAITPQEWQELNAAHAAAMKANPDLLQKAQEISAKMRAFQQKLDTAIVKIDPNAAPIIDRLEHGMPGQHPPTPISPSTGISSAPNAQLPH